MKIITRDDAAEFVKKFINEKLAGDIDNLTNYDFASLDKDDEFCCPNKDHDCDDSNIMNAIYVDLWGEHLPDCTYKNIGRGKLYRGDTIHTFNTMFGSKTEYFERYNPNLKLREKVFEFKKQICKIGQGWVAEEALAIGIYCALKFPQDFVEGVSAAVNITGDSDSTGAIAGNILGVILGIENIPKYYLENLKEQSIVYKLASDLYSQYQDDQKWHNDYPGC